MEITIPIISVVAKPFTVPLPKKNRTAAAISVVYVTIQNGRSCSLEACLQRIAQALTQNQFFLHTFKNNDIRIYRHTYRKHDTCDTGQCQRHMEQTQRHQLQANINYQCPVCRKAQQLIGKQHINQYQSDTDNTCLNACGKRIRTQTRTYVLHLNYIQVKRQRACTNEGRKLFCPPPR